MSCFFTFCSDMKPRDTKRQVTTQIYIHIYRVMIKSVTQHSYFEKKPASRWVDFKTTHHELDGTQNLHMRIH